MLSNTETPYYYGQFRDQVLRGEIIVNQHISDEMNRIDALIASPIYYYDGSVVEGYIKYCESELTLTNGEPLTLLPTFKLWAEQLLGWYYFIERSVYEPYGDRPGGHYVRKQYKRRLTNKQYLIIGRGAAKTMYESTMQSYFLNLDGTANHQVTVAPLMAQAEEVLLPFKVAISRSRGPLFKFLTSGSLQNTTGSKMNRVKLASTKKGIVNSITESYLEVRPMSIDALQGLNSKINTIDEWLSCDIREDVMTPLEQGAAKNIDWVIIATSSEGTVRNGPGDTIKMELQSILKGDYVNPHVSIWWYALDNIDEVEHPEMWIKANPNLGKTVEYETYQLEKERMEANPSIKNDILAKRFGIPAEGYTYFFTFEETIPHNKVDFFGMPCALGIDLSQGDDFCAFTFWFPLRGGAFGVKSRNYITSKTMTKLPSALHDLYDKFLQEGSVVVLDGTVLDMTEVYNDLEVFLDQTGYEVRCVGYDPYNAKEFMERWCTENGSFGVEKVIQGARTESVPLGELKKMAADRLIIFDEEVMKFALGNCIAIEDTNGNRKLQKKRYDQKIDPVAAMMDAYISYKLNKDAFD